MELLKKNLLPSFFLTTIFFLSLTQLVDTDAFTHLSLGREIFNHKGFSAKELFNYPSLENTFSNSEWLFGLVFYLAYLLLDVKGVILLKALIIALTFYVLLKDSLLLSGTVKQSLNTPSPSPLPLKGVEDSGEGAKNLLVSIAILFVTAIFMRYRFVERPDIALMLFLSFNIYCLNVYVQENKPYIYILPFIQILWANIHPSVSLMAIPFIAFIAGGFFQRLMQSKLSYQYLFTPSYRQIFIIVVVFAASIFASLINPYASAQLTAPASLITSSWWMDEVMELKPPTWDLWKSPFIFSAIILGSFLLAIVKKRISLIQLSMLLPFIYIGLSGIRFVFLIGLVGGPMIARNINVLIAEDTWERLQGLKSYKAAVPRLIHAGTGIGLVLVMLFTTVFTISGRGHFSQPDKVFGLRIGYEQLPEGALKYLDEKGIYGRLFNTFQWGGYITWRDYPKRMTFVDGRGAISSDLLESLGKARFQPAVLNNLSERYGFEVVLLHYNPIVSKALQGKNPDVDLGLFAAPKDWALVYWDDISMVYLKRTSKSPLNPPFFKGGIKGIIDEDEYHYVRPANGYTYLARQISTPPVIPPLLKGGQRGVTYIVKELERNLSETDSKKAHLYLGFVYGNTGNPQKAIELLKSMEDFEAYQLLGSAYEKIGEANKAILYYKKALNIETSLNILYNLGRLYIAEGELEKGINYLEAAVKKDEKFAAAYPPLIDAYRRMGLEDKYAETKQVFEKVSAYTEEKTIFERGLKFSTEGRYADAIEEFKRFLEISPLNPAGRSNLGFAYYMTGNYDGAYQEFQKTLEIDSKFPNAYYGLGLIYNKKGETEKAKGYFEEYLKLEPKGSWARKVREELKALEAK